MFGKFSVSQMRWHEPECIVSHGFGNKTGRWMLGLLPRKNQQDWVRDWIDIIAGERGVQDPYGDRNEESHVEFKSVVQDDTGLWQINECIQILKRNTRWTKINLNM